MKIIIGLGNPGTQYAHTRHNVGFMMVDKLQKVGFRDWSDTKHKGIIALNEIKKDLALFKPITFMNLSGDAVQSIVNFFKLNPKTDILVVSDDIDMEFGKVRYRTKGSHGGQNGLRDIIAKLGTDEFARIKIGIGRHEQYSVSDWVLSKFTKEEQEKIEGEVFEEVGKKINEWLSSSNT